MFNFLWSIAKRLETILLQSQLPNRKSHNKSGNLLIVIVVAIYYLFELF